MASDAFLQSRARADVLLRDALSHPSYAFPLYSMLRYFLGYEDEHGTSVSGIAGKRIRAGLTLLVAELFGGGAAADDMAVAIELFHNFTLIHDDIEDNDELRRGRPTVWKVWGIDHGINAGDAQALLTTQHLLRAAARDGKCGLAAAEYVTAYFQEVCEGQYLDFELARLPLADSRVTLEAYLTMIRKKTSVLVGAAVAAGGIVAGCDTTTREALFTYGESLGLAYQIADDVASVWGDEEKTGKTRWGDLRECKKTYPVIVARDRDTSGRLAALYDHAPLPEDAIRDVCALLDTHGAYEATRVLGESYAAEALASIDRVPLGAEAKGVLVDIVRTMVRFVPNEHHVD